MSCFVPPFPPYHLLGGVVRILSKLDMKNGSVVPLSLFIIVGWDVFLILLRFIPGFSSSPSFYFISSRFRYRLKIKGSYHFFFVPYAIFS